MMSVSPTSIADIPTTNDSSVKDLSSTVGGKNPHVLSMDTSQDIETQPQVLSLASASEDQNKDIFGSDSEDEDNTEVVKSARSSVADGLAEVEAVETADPKSTADGDAIRNDAHLDDVSIDFSSGSVEKDEDDEIVGRLTQQSQRSAAGSPSSLSDARRGDSGDDFSGDSDSGSDRSDSAEKRKRRGGRKATRRAATDDTSIADLKRAAAAVVETELKVSSCLPHSQLTVQ